MQLVLYPRLSEKAYGSATAGNIYVFNVPMSSNKIEIKQAVEAQYSVKVDSVNITRTSGKVKRTAKKGGRQIKGKRSDYKKAYVKVAQGQSIPVFVAEEGDEK